VYYFIRLCYFTAATLDTTALEQSTCTSFSAASQSHELRETAVVCANVHWWEEGSVSETSVVHSNSFKALWFLVSWKQLYVFSLYWCTPELILSWQYIDLTWNTWSQVTNRRVVFKMADFLSQRVFKHSINC